MASGATTHGSSAMADVWSYHDGDLALQGELYRPAGAPNSASVLVVHEADGIGGNVRRHCRRLAELGYLAAAADIHGGGRILRGEAMQEALEPVPGRPAAAASPRPLRAGGIALP